MLTTLLLDLVKSILQANGYEVKCTLNSLKTIALTHRWDPDLIFLETIIIGGESFTVTESIYKFSSVPIIILAALEDKLNILKCLAADADDCIVKPLFYSELIAQVPAIEYGLSLPKFQNHINRFFQRREYLIGENSPRAKSDIAGELVPVTFR